MVAKVIKQFFSNLFSLFKRDEFIFEPVKHVEGVSTDLYDEDGKPIFYFDDRLTLNEIEKKHGVEIKEIYGDNFYNEFFNKTVEAPR